MISPVFLASLCLLLSAQCFGHADDDLAAIIARGGENEQVTLKASQVDAKSKQIQIDNSRPIGSAPRPKRALGRTDSDSNKPMTCNLKKYTGVYYFGMLITVARDIGSAELCGSVCWKYQVSGKRCQSVNYIESSRKCELMQDLLDVKNLNALRDNAEAKSEAVYIVPLSCVEGAQASDAIDAKKNKVVQGTCGQTFVEPRIPRDALIDRSTQRIVGGTEAKPHSLPYQVSLRQGYSRMMHFCGGTLIRVNSRDETDIVVTAAHCLADEPANMQIVAGAHNVYKTANGEQRVNSSMYVIHPGYDETTMVNDIAVIKLAKPIKFGQSAQPACLPASGEQVADNAPGLVSGWGHTQESAKPAENLMQVIVPTVNSQRCIANYRAADEPVEIVPELMLCAGHATGGKDACQGDSGGPLTYKTGRGFVLHGVVSFGEGCARAGRPGIYARVSSYTDWIQKNINELSSLTQ